MPPQVAANHYRKRYDTKERFISYWTQVDEVFSLSPRSVLEVGIGNGFVSYYLRKQGLPVTTLDIAADLQPQVIGSVESLPFKAESFDVVMACQVLEHLPFERLNACLQELARVSASYILISLPDRATVISFSLRVPRVGTLQRHIPFNLIGAFTRFRPNRQHYWEIGWKGFPAERILTIMRDNHLEVVRHYRVFEYPYHHFFVLKKPH